MEDSRSRSSSEGPVVDFHGRCKASLFRATICDMFEYAGFELTGVGVWLQSVCDKYIKWI